MVTIRLHIKNHLAEYLNGKYYHRDKGCVCIPDHLDLYHKIWDLLLKRPDNCPPERFGNIILGLPDRRIGKDPATYNYLGERSIRLIERSIEILFFRELHEQLDFNKRELNIQYQDTVFLFKAKYGIESLTDDALIKDFYRYRELIRQRKVRRKYEKTSRKR
ncbi:MAG: hypothetical protein BGN96_13900 [Bacteroidales bacterium 45-6]|nr:MAG: hypothetical protein BGN96_13900 [Bacteroidales bacterium 45-6]